MKNTISIISAIFLVSFLFLNCSDDERSNKELLENKTYILLEDLAVTNDGEILINFLDTLIDNKYNHFYYRYLDDRYIFSTNGYFVEDDGINNDYGKGENPYGYKLDGQVHPDIDTLATWSLAENTLILNPVIGKGASTTHPYKIKSEENYIIENIDDNYLTISKAGAYNKQNVILRKTFKKYYGMY
jgi:hypothetical protein